MAEITCPKCGAPVAPGTVFCPSCDYLLDVSFLGADVGSDSAGEFDEPTDIGLPPPMGAEVSNGAMIVGDLEDDFETMLSDQTGAFSTVGVFEAAPIYVTARVASIVEANAVLGIKPGVSLAAMTLSPLEQHVASFIDGQRPVARVRTKTGLTAADLTIALGMLTERGVIALKGHLQPGDLKQLLDDNLDSAEGAVLMEDAAAGDGDTEALLARAAAANPFSDEDTAGVARSSPNPITGLGVDAGADLLANLGDGAMLADDDGVGPFAFNPAALDGDDAPSTASDDGADADVSFDDGAESGLAGDTADIALAADDGDDGADAEVPVDAADEGGADAEAPLDAGDDAGAEDGDDIVIDDGGDDGEEIFIADEGDGLDAAAADDSDGDSLDANPMLAQARLAAEEAAAVAAALADDASGMFEVPAASPLRAAPPPAAPEVFDLPLDAISELPLDALSPLPSLPSLDDAEAEEPPFVPPPAMPSASINLDSAMDGFLGGSPVRPAEALKVDAEPGVRPAMNLKPALAARPAVKPAARPQPSPAPMSSSLAPGVPGIPGAARPAVLPPGPPPRSSGLHVTAARSAPAPSAGAGGAPAAAKPAAAAAPAPIVTSQMKERAKVFLEMGLKDLREGKKSRAMAYVKMAAEIDPTDPQIVGLLANWGGAASVAKAQSEDQKLLAEATKAEQAGEHDKALELLRKTLALTPDQADLHNRVGILLAIHKKDYSGATDAFMKAVELDQKNVAYRSNLGKTFKLSEGKATAEDRKMYQGNDVVTGKDKVDSNNASVLDRLKKLRKK